MHESTSGTERCFWIGIRLHAFALISIVNLFGFTRHDTKDEAEFKIKRLVIQGVQEGLHTSLSLQ